MTVTTMTLAQARHDGFAVPAQVTAPPRLTERFPWLYPWAVRVLRLRRRWQWATSPARWASTRAEASLPHTVHRHASVLMRALEPDLMHLQRNKVTNLRLAGARVDGVLIRPGETFSFNRVVGSCTRRKGYVDGIRLAAGVAQPGVGGGICQLANLVHWLVLHSPMTVVERSEHSFDPFPDRDRVLPWGVGCSIAYNYVDLVFRNDTDTTFQLRSWLEDEHLRGELLADESPRVTYVVEAWDEVFLRHEGRTFRRNEIWRRERDATSGEHLREELLMRNCALTMYVPDESRVVQVEG